MDPSCIGGFTKHAQTQIIRSLIVPIFLPVNTQPAPITIVLDTNVCLDLFVFHDPRWQPLLSAMESGTVKALTRTDCRTEWLLVLDYPHLPVTPESKPQAIAAFDRLIDCVPIAEVNTFGLPVCTDKDDQKFLELSRQENAQMLVTKDRALLKLGKKTRRAGLFLIIRPDQFEEALQQLACS